MLTRNFLILCSLAVLLVQADLDTNNDHAAQAMSTDKDSTSEEAPTESMNAISSDQPNEKPQYYNGGTADVSSTSVEVRQDAPKPNGVTGPGVAANSVEDQEEDESSDEGLKKRIVPPPPPPPPAPQQNSRKLVGPAGGNRRKAPAPQQKRRSRPSRRQP
ncbi:serine/arginine repetitive matrix protein 1 isoform X1 [Coregonus clupeaformis]|uniref:serine/arginine repetitive matrix protein 1 isoform X1 n=1 Tax=Coregonus clupeaformis TaxID=59861 RepID=UPI001BE02FBB|nr:serine/arginine repetitive matrix protein 1 isoform X1 [Coregonus clupeaformis]